MPIFREGDVRDQMLMESILHEFKIDAVIHLAGLKAVGESTQDPLKYYDHNVGGTISL
jgi:UDP-glucose 4-epimerase